MRETPLGSMLVCRMFAAEGTIVEVPPVEDTIEDQPNKKKSNPNAPDYGPWIPDFLMKYVYLICAVLFVMTVVVLFVFGDIPIGIACAIITLVAVGIALYIKQVKKLFRPGRNSIMTQLHHYLLDKLDWDGQGRMLDCGSGNGELAIRCAFKYPEAHITATDHWNKSFMEWGYSLWQCRENARIEEVTDRVVFVASGAESLGFDDETFDAVASCFVRMDTNYEGDKRPLVKETLRSLKKGGHFSLMCMFKHEELYGDVDELIEELEDAGISEIHYEPDVLSKMALPGMVKAPLMIKNAGLLYGVK